MLFTKIRFNKALQVGKQTEPSSVTIQACVTWFQQNHFKSETESKQHHVFTRNDNFFYQNRNQQLNLVPKVQKTSMPISQKITKSSLTKL